MNRSNQSRTWPTPSFDRVDTAYECSMCASGVNPDSGDKQAALLIAGSTRKLCAECAEDFREQIAEARHGRWDDG